MDTAKKSFSGLKKIFGNKEKVTKAVLLLGIIGIALVFISDMIPKTKPVAEKSSYGGTEISYERELQLEERLEKMIEKIDGAGKAKVMITLASSNEYFYAFDSKKEQSEKDGEVQISAEEKPTVIDGKSGEEPLVTKVGESGVRGVFVICEGGDKPQVTESIINAVCAVLGIGSSRVSVAKMA